MRVCSPHCGFDPIWSGGAVYERELLSAVARQTVVDLHLPMPAGKVVPEILARAVEPRRPRRGWRWWLAPLFAVPAIRRCWDRHGFDILRAHSARFMGPACLLAKLPQIPLVVHHHHLDGVWQEWVDSAVLQRADLVTTDSGASLRRLQDVTGARLALVPPGVGQEFFEAVAPRGSSGVASLLFLGELKARKNPLALPRILRAVLDRGGLAELSIVGDGACRAELERAIRRLRLDGGVHLAGRVPNEARPAFYAAADVFLFPSRLEGFGMCVLEAMATGLPVVATATGAIPEMIEHGRTGFLVTDPDDTDLFADYVLTLVKSPALRREMGTAARTEAARWTWGRSAQRLAALYRELV